MDVSLTMTPRGSAASNTVVFWSVSLPVCAGCAAGWIRLLDEDGVELSRLPLTWQKTERGVETWGASHRFLQSGLFFCRVLLTLYPNEIDFGRGRDGQPDENGVDNWQFTVYDASFRVPARFAGGVIYQIFPDRFFSAPTEAVCPYTDRDLVTDRTAQPRYNGLDDKNFARKNVDYYGGNLNGITEKLDYLSDLGVTALYLNPIFEAHSNHRYNTADYRKIDPLLGTEADFTRLCAEAEKRGIGVILDGVFSHTGSDSVYFNAERRYDSVGAANSVDSPYYPWYRFTHWPDRYDCWWDVETLPETSEDCPSFREFITGPDGVLRHWLRLGAAGWRLDVADELPDDFIEAVRAAIKAEKPDALLLGEVWENASNKISYGKRRHYFLGRELDSVMNYPVANAIIDYLRGGPAEALGAVLQELARDYPSPVLSVLMNHLGTHDTPRLITRLAGEPERGRGRDWQAKQRLNETQFARGAALVKLAAVISYTVYGIPSVYYGDEIGMQGYGDPFNRGFYRWDAPDVGLTAHYRALGRLRKDHPMLADAGFEVLCAKGGLFVFARRKGKELLLTAVNRAETDAQFTPAQTLGLRTVLAEGGRLEDGRIVLTARGFLIAQGEAADDK